MYDKLTETSILFDLYGQLLTPKQRDVFKMYYEDDFSLAEIAEDSGISRQGVHDTVKKGEKALKEYECKLGLFKKLIETENIFNKIETKIDNMIVANNQNETLINDLKEIKKLVAENI